MNKLTREGVMEMDKLERWLEKCWRWATTHDLWPVGWWRSTYICWTMYMPEGAFFWKPRASLVGGKKSERYFTLFAGWGMLSIHFKQGRR